MPDKIKKSLSYSIRDGCCHAIMVGTGETYMVPFAIFLGANNLLLGWLSSFPLFAGSLAQMVAVYLLDRVHRRKIFNVWPALFQALLYGSMFFFPFFFREHGSFWLLAWIIPYFIFGFIVGPSWNSWMGDLVPPKERGVFFGQRNRYKTICQMVATLLAGWILSGAKVHDAEWLGYGIIFGIAAMARFASALYHAKIYEPPFVPPTPEQAFTFRTFVKKSPFNNFGKFTIYSALVQLATHAAAPFITLYMLRDLRWTYFQFTVSTTVFILVQALAYYPLGKMGDRFGNRRVLQLSGFMISFLPVLWIFSKNFGYLLFVQFLAGLAWAAFSTSTANFIFDAVTPPKRPRCFAYYNVLSNLGTFVGATLGGFLSFHLPSHVSFLGFSWSPFSSLYFLFMASGFLRFVFALIFIPMIREVKEVEPHSWRNILYFIEEFVPFRKGRSYSSEGTNS